MGLHVHSPFGTNKLNTLSRALNRYSRLKVSEFIIAPPNRKQYPPVHNLPDYPAIAELCLPNYFVV